MPQEEVERVVKPAPSRYRNEIAKYIVHRSLDCERCGKCVEVCSHGVHERKPGFKYFGEPQPSPVHRTVLRKDRSLLRGPLPARGAANPGKSHVPGARRFSLDGGSDSGDVENGRDRRCARRRHTITITSAAIPAAASTGSGSNFPNGRPSNSTRIEIDTSISLNKRDDGRPEVKIDVPWYGGGMSFGSVSNVTQLSKARAAVAFNTFTCTGEGGYMERMRPYDDHVITQVATGLFGVREETIQRVPIVEFKYAQGAKPGLGGHLLGDKNTPAVARMREAVLGISLFSPFPFHSVYSIEDHAKHIDWIKHVNRRALISTKVSTPTDVDMVAVGSYSAGTHIVHIDGGYGGTGAAPDIAKKNIAMPIEYAIGKVHNFLADEGVRDKVTLIASGGIRSAHDIAKAIALGADGVVIGTAELVALGCVRCSRCESGRGCPRGIATTDPELCGKMDLDWGTQRLINLYSAWRKTLVGILQRLGLRSVSELRGRTDLLMHLDYTNDVPANK